MKNLRKKLLLIVFCLCTVGSVMSVNSESDLSGEKPEVIREVSLPITPNLLTDPSLKYLDTILRAKPSVVARIIKAKEAINCVFGGIENIEKKLESLHSSPEKKEAVRALLIMRLCRLVIDPVRIFFDAIYTFKDLLEPLLTESFGAAGIDYESSLLYRFLTIKVEQVPSFFDDNIRTKTELLNVCTEFNRLFVDLEGSLVDAFAGGYAYLQDHLPDSDDDEEDDTSANSGDTKAA